jgi:serine/threonine-protein kinase HipA
VNRELVVHIDVAGVAVRCGRLWTRSAPREGSSFEYDRAWLENRLAFALDPELPLAGGQFHTARPLFRAFEDPAPDRWGQTLLRRAEAALARREGRAPRRLTSVDFLSLIDDSTRLGALRFKDAGAPEHAPFLSHSGRPVPPLVNLPRLLSAANRLVRGDETDDDLALLLAPGTSLGGARPKASVRGPDGELLIAKFPRPDDDWPVTRWEAVGLSLASAAAIRVPRFRLELIGSRPVLLLSRFDRDGDRRIAFMSGMTALTASDLELHSYVELAEILRQIGSQPAADLAELWRRMVFNILISNTDDHLRNHGFLRDAPGWRLAPAYDLNPLPPDVKPRVHALAINEVDPTSNLESAFEVAKLFGLSSAESRRVAREVATVVQSFRAVGTKLGLKRKELERMRTAFEHEELERALA